MGVYQRHGNFMVFYHDETGKRRDKSFGKAADSESNATLFDAAIKSAKKNGWQVSSEEIISQFFSSVIERKPAQKAVTPVSVVRSVEQVSVQVKTVKFRDLWKAYSNEIFIAKKSYSYQKEMVRLISTVYSKFFDLDKDVSSFTYVDNVIPFMKYISGANPKTGKERSAKTVNRYCQYLNALFSYGIRIGMTKHNPMQGWRRVKQTPREFKLNLEDAKKIMDAATPHIKWAIEVCFNLGTRSGESELLSLKWENVNFEAKTVSIFGRKTNTWRTVPISDNFANRLLDMKSVAKTEYIIEYRGKKVTRLNHGFNNAVKNAGITYQTRLYDFRHLFATTMLANGADLSAVSKLMGHARISMTADNYLHLLQGEKERAIQLLPKLN